MGRMKIEETNSFIRYWLKLIYATRKGVNLVAVSRLGKPKVLPGTSRRQLDVYQTLRCC